MHDMYVAYHDFSASQSTWRPQRGGHLRTSVDVLATNCMAFLTPSVIRFPVELKSIPRQGKFISMDYRRSRANTTQGCNLTQIETFSSVWMAHSRASQEDLQYGCSLGLRWASNTNTDTFSATFGVDDSGSPGQHGTCTRSLRITSTQSGTAVSTFGLRTQRQGRKLGQLGEGSTPTQERTSSLDRRRQHGMCFIWLGRRT